MLLLVAAALAVPAFGITLIWQARLDAEVDEQLRCETDKLRRFARTAREPATGEPFADGASLLTEFMAVNLPSREETFFSIVDGRPDRRSPNTAPARLDLDAAVVARLSRGAARSSAGSTPRPDGCATASSRCGWRGTGTTPVW